MDEKRYCVYTHTNKINNKIYVGMTSLKPEQRWNKGQGYSQQPKFYQDIEKYGWDNFIHKIEFENLTKKKYDGSNRGHCIFTLNCGTKQENQLKIDFI